ncbi:MAG: transglutaminase family protein [Deltaproteobacteria bacterium]|nr:transglutaminase family protein [Deltaproteobacteria bacterium]MBW1874798.1 transglutaminase family protein [Deltaproteobacteria bacterium]MBW2210773.1 transglutaminase family protein [Deltaproteobacteria bacterium]MBW2214207.1 transglutaminase family protein [Deltaproteobacteria bacterium]MBW2379403.1 transglutaminase family protein [Deltaproteobacteria bacterium]
MPDALRPTPTIDCDHPAVISFAESSAAGAQDARERAVKLYYATRDRIRYDPYSLLMTVPGLRASATIEAGHGWCVPKAVLLAACCRALGIHARLGFADVKNHLSTERLRKAMSTDVFYWHGYTAIQLDGRWLKATPAFNIELCEKFRIKPLEFDGTEDSIYHPFDLQGRKHMEYLRFHGEYDDLPLDKMMATYARHYSQTVFDTSSGDFDLEVDEETRNQVR